MLRDERQEPALEKTLHYDGGIISFVEYLNKNKEPLYKVPIYFAARNGDCFVEVAIQYNGGYAENVYSYANNIATIEGGTHLTGFRSALTKLSMITPANTSFSRTMTGISREKMSVKDWRRLSASSFRNRSLRDRPRQTGNSEIRTLVESVMNERLAAYLEENPSIARTTIDKCLSASRARDAARKARDMTRRKNALESNACRANLPTVRKKTRASASCSLLKVIPPVVLQSKAGTQVPGDSPALGKMLNVEKARIDKVYDNEKLQPVIMALEPVSGATLTSPNSGTTRSLSWRMLMLTALHPYPLLYLLLPLYAGTGQGRECVSRLPPLYRVYEGNTSFYAYDDSDVLIIKEKTGWKDP